MGSHLSILLPNHNKEHHAGPASWPARPHPTDRSASANQEEENRSWVSALVLSSPSPSRGDTVVLSVFPFQTADGHKHSLLDRAPPERPLAVAGQGLDANGLAKHPLFQRVLKDADGGIGSDLA